MTTKSRLTTVILTLVFGGFCLPAWAVTNSATYQGITFEITASGNLLNLVIKNATGGTGNWADIGFLKAIELKDIGDVTGSTLAGWESTLENGLSTNTIGHGANAGTEGCTTGGTPGACFWRASDSPLALTDYMSFDMYFDGETNFDDEGFMPTLKLLFLENWDDTKGNNDLYSYPVAPIPEPGIYALMAAGLMVVGWAARTRTRNHPNAN